MKFHLICLLFAIAIFAPAQTRGCPACNIYNYLGESVLSSSNVFVGRLIAVETNYHATVEVIRTLCGNYRSGQKVKIDAYATTNEIGNTFIFSDPKSFGPSFPQLGMDFQDEVEFLVQLKTSPENTYAPRMTPFTPQKDYHVKNASEAIKRVQGVSNQSKQAGMDFLRTCRPFPFQKTTDAIEASRSKIIDGKGDNSTQNSAGNLIEALLLDNEAETGSYLVEQVRFTVAQKDAPVNWKDMPRSASWRGQWLAALLGLPGTNWVHRKYADSNPYRKNHPALNEKEKQAVLEALPKMRGMLLAESIFALYDTKLMTMQQLQALLANKPGIDEFALGIMWSAQNKISIYDADEGPKPLADLRTINSWGLRPELKSAVQQYVDYGEKKEEKIAQKQQKPAVEQKKAVSSKTKHKSSR